MRGGAMRYRQRGDNCPIVYRGFTRSHLPLHLRLNKTWSPTSMCCDETQNETSRRVNTHNIAGPRRLSHTYAELHPN